MSDDRGAPLYDALWALSGMTTRHQLRETPVADYTPQQGWHDPYPHATEYGLPPGHVYGSDDTPGGPPEPPLGDAEWVERPDLAPRQGPDVVACPTCGGGVHPSRIR